VGQPTKFELARCFSELESTVKRQRISIDVLPEVLRRLRLGAAKRDLTVWQYVLDAIEDRRREDLREDGKGMSALKTKADPVLAELWDNRRDSEYDRL
jgi:hypothetical protein